MKVLVVGATGFVGGAVARHLRAAGHDLVGVARSDRTAARLAGQGISPLRADLGSGLAKVVTAAASAECEPQRERLGDLGEFTGRGEPVRPRSGGTKHLRLRKQANDLDLAGGRRVHPQRLHVGEQ